MLGDAPTLVVRRAARAAKAHIAQVCSIAMSVNTAAWDGHGTVSVWACHGAV